MEVLYYTRKKCPLCEDGKLILQILQRDYAFSITEIDIETSDELTERFGLMIPVVEIDGEIIQCGMIDLIAMEEKLKEFLE